MRPIEKKGGKRDLPNICVVRLVRFEQQWTVSVDGVSRLVSAITAVVSDVRLCLSLMMENPSGYTRLIRTLWLLYGVFVK